MHRIMRLCVVCLLTQTLTFGLLEAKTRDGLFLSGLSSSIRTDTTAEPTLKGKDTTAIDSMAVEAPVDTNKVATNAFLKNGVHPEIVADLPYSSLQQMLKGKVAGVYVEEPSGEPGTQMSMFIRGTSIPFTSHKDIYNAQPTVILDGVPLIMDDPFAFNIQSYDYNRRGPATNLLSSIDPNNIASITVLKDFAAAAKYGPRAANGGVIVIKTKAPVIGGRKISVNAYTGFVQRPSVHTTNARFENNFRQTYYDRYAGLNEILNYPLYLRDSSNTAYYGPANWTDKYYKNQMIRGVHASLSSGTERANFRFAMGNQQTENPGDDTKMDRYNAMFELNMVPLKWLTMSTMITATRLERQRNTYLRDRFAEVQYLPDLLNPIPSNKEAYGRFQREQNKSIDANKSNIVNGYFELAFKFFDELEFTSNFGFSYNEGLRDVFYPSTLMETVNYVSNYFGYNQRLMFNNTLKWHHNWDKTHDLTLEAGQIFQSDFSRYNYTYAYNGPNDLIKVNELHSDPNNSNYLTSKAFPRELTYMFLDKMSHRLLSFYGQATYSYQNKLNLSALVRADGSSSAQPDNWWMVSPTFAINWDLKNTFEDGLQIFQRLNLHASWGRVARLLTDDRFGEGPQYVSDMSFSNNPVMFSYTAFPGLSRPYSDGYVGYNIKWPYTQQTDIGVDIGMLHEHLNISLDVYNKVSHNMLFKVPSGTQYGYSGIWENGLEVRNRGLDVAIQASVFPEESKFQWIPSVNFNFNENQLMALPNGLQELVVGSGATARKLKVGHAIDQYWLLENNGIYNRERDIPVNPQTNAKIDYKGTPLNAGDPIWKDLNGDHTINNEDKIMTGHYLPKMSGGFGSDFVYKNFTLGLSFYYTLDKDILNQDVANHLDFANREGKISMDAIKEITFWSKTADYNRYPLYNPWSKVEPYRLDQDLFLEDGSFLKLRSVSLQYDVTKASWWNKKSIVRGFKIYATASNLFTVTPYTGGDPELTYYNGVDQGYGLTIPRTYTIGVKMDF